MKTTASDHVNVKELENAISQTSVWLKELILLKQKVEKEGNHLTRVK